MSGAKISKTAGASTNAAERKEAAEKRMTIVTATTCAPCRQCPRGVTHLETMERRRANRPNGAVVDNGVPCILRK